MKPKSPPWMALWVRDFVADTEGLDGEQTGVYALILMSMWMNGGWLPDDDRALARIGRVSRFKWRRLRPIIMAFLTKLDGNRLTQKRLLRELWLSRELGKFPARTVTRIVGQQEFDFDGFSVATRERARGQSQSHPEREQKGRRLALAREAAARGVLPPAVEITDELRDLIQKMGLRK
jgi:uncharacterized protein YdaU (DUF1376 family)